MPVVSGFSCGVGAMMVILQLRTLLGLPAAPCTTPRQPARAARPGRCRTCCTRAMGAVAPGFDRHRGSDRAPRGDGRGRRRPCSASAWPSPPATLLGWHERPLGEVSLRIASVCRLHLDADRCHRRSCPPALGLAFVASVNILITSRVVEHFQGRHRPLRAADADGELALTASPTSARASSARR